MPSWDIECGLTGVDTSTTPTAPTDLNERFLWRARALSEHADANSAPARQTPLLPPPAILTTFPKTSRS